MIGFITMIGYILLKKKWYDVLGGTLKAIIGMLILNVGSGGLVSTFRPILAGLKDRFNLTATLISAAVVVTCVVVFVIMTRS